MNLPLFKTVWSIGTFCQMIKADLFQKIIERKEPTWRISSQVKKHFLTILTKILGDQPSSDATSRGGWKVWGSQSSETDLIFQLYRLIQLVDVKFRFLYQAIVSVHFKLRFFHPPILFLGFKFQFLRLCWSLLSSILSSTDPVSCF